MLLIVYLIGISEQVRSFVGGVASIWTTLFIFFVLFKLFLITGSTMKESEKVRIDKTIYRKSNMVIFLVLGMLFHITETLIPDKNTLYAMAGIYVGKEIIENPRVESIMSKSLDAIDIKLDEIIEGKKHEQASTTE